MGVFSGKVGKKFIEITVFLETECFIGRVKTVRTDNISEGNVT